MNLNKKILVIGIVILIGIFLFFTFFKSNNQEKVQLTGNVKEFTIKAFQFGYDPSIIRVNLGDKVKITAFSEDVSHGLNIPDFGVNMFLSDDSTPQTVEFIANKKGTFTFYCSVFCGSGHSSMKGELIVS